MPDHSSYRDRVIGDGAVLGVVAADDSLNTGASTRPVSPSTDMMQVAAPTAAAAAARTAW